MRESKRLDKSDGGSIAPTGPGDDPVVQAKSWLRDLGVDLPDDQGADRKVGTPVAPASREKVSDAGVRQTAAAPQHRDTGNEPDPDADPEVVARTIVLRKLSAQAQTRAELAQALKAKQVPDQAADTVLDRMQQVGLVDDSAFARDWVESRQQRRYLSKAALRRELTNKGVDRDTIDSALQVVDNEDELRAARSLMTRRWATMATLEPEVRHRRLAAMLARRGFSSAVVARILGETHGVIDE